MAGLEEIVKGYAPTELLYLRDSYMKACDCEVVQSKKDGKSAYVLAKATIFHPKSGGQPGDVGYIKGESGELEVKKVMGVWTDDGYYVIHYGRGSVESGKANFQIDWETRYLYMKRHTAAHLLDHCLAEATGTKTLTLGSWLGDPAYLDYAGSMPSEDQIRMAERLENDYIHQGLPVSFSVISASDATRLGAPNEERLPKSAKELRLVRVGEFEWIPCGGTHVNNTKEIGHFTVKGVNKIEGGYRVYFDVDKAIG
ncbi:MAG: alanine--tRNA ligase-related protein [Thermoprotei archaeon]